MALTLRTIIQFPIFAPTSSNQLNHHHRPATEVRFARWNNANAAQKFIRHDRNQKEIEDQMSSHKSFGTDGKIANLHQPTTTGATSVSSRPPVPGKISKYPKLPVNPRGPKSSSHPAFNRIVRLREIPEEIEEESGIKVSEKGISYVIPEAPFEFQYSYTETPKVKPLKLREPPIAPFGPETMPRPWTGRKPLTPSKKKIDFDSFRLPPPHKKGVKPVQAPGPFLAGSGPKYARSREEVLGEPLTKEEIKDLIQGCLKSRRQLNMGRDGLTHNMLDNIHALWKRKRVCKIKCKGVCTVDMDNIRQQLEEKTGGKIIYSKGGVIFLFRGRNYNFKTRPIFPLMLWKPVTPVYPRLIQRAPEGLTVEEAIEMRKKGKELTPICKLGKNGVYCDLVRNVREAFEACELVRINCEGMNPSDYRKIGAKLKDLVPCVLISFEQEHILIWRGREWKSMFTLEEDPKGVNRSGVDGATSVASVEDQSACLQNLSPRDVAPENGNTDNDLTVEEDENNQLLISMPKGIDESKNVAVDIVLQHKDQIESPSIVSENVNDQADPVSSPCTEGVMLLLQQAVQDGSAIILDDSCLDADIVYEKAVAFAQTAPPDPIFRRSRPKKVETKITEKQEAGEVEEKVVAATVSERNESKTRNPRTRKKDPKDSYLDVVPQATLRVDELAKLLG